MSLRCFGRVYLLVVVTLFGFTQCQESSSLPPADPDNGGLFLPDDFDAVVVVDSLPGRARHLAVRDNGDIFVKKPLLRRTNLHHRPKGYQPGWEGGCHRGLW